jgi:S1-C subfamily serine protease
MRNFVVVALCIAALQASACERQASGTAAGAIGSAPIELSAGKAWQGDLDLDSLSAQTFRIEVPNDTLCMRVTLEADDVDFDLLAQPGNQITDPEQAAYSSKTEGLVEQLDFDRFGANELVNGTWFFDVRWPYMDLPRTAERKIERARFRIVAELIAARVDGELEPGEAFRSSLDDDTGNFRTFKIRVPDGAPALRLDLSEVTSDLDLYARHGAQVIEIDEQVVFAEHNWGHESLLIRPGDPVPLESGDWFVDVVDRAGAAHREPFAILATLSSAVPQSLLALPAIPKPRGNNPLARALLAVVEIATDDGLGSGALLTDDGWILTNSHVVDGKLESEVVVSLSLDPTLPPQEALRAKVVAVDEQRDLALVHVTGGLYGQPIPADWRLPTLEIGRASELEIGDPLWVVGYPSTGGMGSRVSISATRGIVSGFEHADFGTLIKTDAEITNGNSGGAALDERGRLVGVPSSVVENGSGQIGYVHPMEAMPDGWREMIKRTEPASNR